MKKIKCLIKHVKGTTAKATYDFYTFNKKYKKIIKKTKNISVDIKDFSEKIDKGDYITVVSCRKISKNKFFRLSSVCK